uniref:SLOG family protein n=2 Tax=Nitrobacteraceae TaxID=41294 RepID=UPI0012FD9234
MNVIVCGGRTFENYAAVKKYLDMLHDLHHFTLLIHGRAKGADTCAHRWAGE